jgi:hypothetical protein
VGPSRPDGRRLPDRVDIGPSCLTSPRVLCSSPADEVRKRRSGSHQGQDVAHHGLLRHPQIKDIVSGSGHRASFIATAVAAGDPAPEMVRRLMRRLLIHQADQLQDDATIVVLEWRTGEEHRMLP